MKEAAGICSDGLCSLEFLLKLDGVSSQKEEKGREVNPSFNTLSDFASLHPEMVLTTFSERPL